MYQLILAVVGSAFGITIGLVIAGAALLARCRNYCSCWQCLSDKMQNKYNPFLTQNCSLTFCHCSSGKLVWKRSDVSQEEIGSESGNPSQTREDPVQAEEGSPSQPRAR